MLTNKEKSNPKTIILIGSTGKGKSTLANVITDLENKFEESGASVSGTREIQKEEFIESNSGIKYAVIDTVGIGDTKLKREEVLDKIAEAVYLARNGISQVFFVIDDKFNPHEMANYDLLKTIIFDQEVVNHTTIVRTRFKKFKESKECEKDIELMIGQGGKLTEIIKSCQRKVVYVDNPSLDLLPAENESEDRKKRREERIARGKETRSESRKVLIEHLKEFCQKDHYKPSKLQKLSAEIVEFMESKKELEKKLRSLEKGETEVTNNQSIATVEINESKVESVFLENNKSKSVLLKEEISSNKGSVVGEENKEELNTGKINIEIDKIVSQLENEKERLEREIQEKRKIVRQKVLDHILNNYDDISEIYGGDTFIGDIVGDDISLIWKRIHEEFSEKELVEKWLIQGFDYKQTKEWANALGESFEPKKDTSFYAWLRDKTAATQFLSYAIDKLKVDYCYGIKNETNKLKIINELHNQQLGLEKSEDLSLQLNLSQQKYDELKKFLKEALVLISQEAKQELVDKLDREIKRKGSLSAPGMTKELMLNTKAVIEGVKELKKELEEELAESKTQTQQKTSIIGISPQEWLKEKFKEYTGLDEEDIEKTIEEYDDNFENKEDLFRKKNQLENKKNSLTFPELIRGSQSDSVYILTDKQFPRAFADHPFLLGRVNDLNENIRRLISAVEERDNVINHLQQTVDNQNQQITNSLVQRGDKETSEIANKLSGLNKKLGEAKAEKTKLQEAIAEKKQQKESLSPDDSKEYKKLIAEIERLENDLKSKEEEIEKLEAKITGLKEKIRQSYGVLQGKIEKEKEELENQKKECVEKIKKNSDWFFQLKERGKEALGVGKIDEKIERLLKAQIDIAKHNSFFAAEIKEELLKEMSEFSNKLIFLCEKQAEITKLEVQLENASKVVRIFNIRGIYSEGNVIVGGDFVMENVELKAQVEMPSITI